MLSDATPCLRASGCEAPARALKQRAVAVHVRPPITDNGIYNRVIARTREGLGQRINPHLFRDCAVTSVAIDDPANIGIASRLLGHRAGSTAERYYNQACGVEASRLMQESLLARRNEILGADDPTEPIR
jgi:integrase